MDGSTDTNSGPADQDVLPPAANATLATCWIALFGGRWLLVPLGQAAGLLSNEQVQMWDEGVLQKCYLILLMITLVVLALRMVRSAQRPASSHPPAASPLSPHSQSPPLPDGEK